MKIKAQTYHSIKRTAGVLGIAILVLLLMAAASRKRELPIVATIVKVQPLPGENWLIDSADIINIIERSMGTPLDEQPAGWVDENRIERFLEQDPFVKNAEVAIAANSEVKIKIEQRQPILRIFDQSGAQYYLDKNGRRMPLSPHFTARTLVATGNIQPFTPEFLQHPDSQMKNLFELARFIIADRFWSALIEQIYFNKRGEYVLIPKIGDQVIIFGKFQNVDDKFFRLRAFYTEAINREGWKKYHSIDLRYKGQVVCELN